MNLDSVQSCASWETGELAHEGIKAGRGFLREADVGCLEGELEWEIGGVIYLSVLIVGGQMGDANLGKAVAGLAEFLSQNFQLESTSLTCSSFSVFS